SCRIWSSSSPRWCARKASWRVSRCRRRSARSRRGSSLLFFVPWSPFPRLWGVLWVGGGGPGEPGLGWSWSRGSRGGRGLLIGFILVMVGISRLKPENLVPQKTINQLQEDASVAKRQVRADDGYQRAA